MARTEPRQRAETEPVFAGGTVARYIESSALLAARIEGDMAARQSIRGEGQRFTSALTLAEFARRIVRGRVSGELSDGDAATALRWVQGFRKICAVVDIDDAVLARVGRPFPREPLRALDAIHLATIDSRDTDPSATVVVTRDKRIAENARAMGYLVE